MSNLFMYKNLRDCSLINKMVEVKTRKHLNKENFRELRLSELIELI